MLKKTKIVATIGPASNSEEKLLSLMKAGTNVFRINFSHASHEDAKKRIKLIRKLNKEHGFNTAILGDLQGPKLRVGKVKEGSFLKNGETLTFTNEKMEGDAKKVYMTYKKFPTDVKVGENILIDDGKILLEVTETNLLDTVKAKVIQGGELKSKKGVNLPKTKVSLPALTEKDIEDALFCMEQEVDWIALSFVRHAQDIKDLKELMKKTGSEGIKIVAKIEKPEAIENIDEIIEQTDAVMVARGDLGIEVPIESVPLTQKSIIQKCKTVSKPVIVATQMMESMIESLTPSRAEVNDVANSVLDGADAVMLSGETSIGKFPVQVVEKMSDIILNVENHDSISIPEHIPNDDSYDRFITDTVCYNASIMSGLSKTKVIATLTFSGYTAYKISSYRPLAHILVFTPNKKIINQLSLVWGVTAFYYNSEKSTDETVIEVNKIANKHGFIEKGDFIINLNSMPLKSHGITNTARLSKF